MVLLCIIFVHLSRVFFNFYNIFFLLDTAQNRLYYAGIRRFIVNYIVSKTDKNGEKSYLGFDQWEIKREGLVCFFHFQAIAVALAVGGEVEEWL